MTYKKGQRVKFAAWTDAFMRGERYGEVSKVGHKYVHVSGERSQEKMGRFTNTHPYGDNPAIEVVS